MKKKKTSRFDHGTGKGKASGERIGPGAEQCRRKSSHLKYLRYDGDGETFQKKWGSGGGKISFRKEIVWGSPFPL